MLSSGPASFSSIHILANVKRKQREAREVTILVNYRGTEPSILLSLSPYKTMTRHMCVFSASSHWPSSCSTVNRGMQHIFRPELQQSTLNQLTKSAEQSNRKFQKCGYAELEATEKELLLH